MDAALRRSIPAFNKDVKDIQARLEDVAFKLRIPQRKPWQGMADNIAASLVLAQQPDKVCLLCLGVWLLSVAVWLPCTPVITSWKVKRGTMAGTQCHDWMGETECHDWMGERDVLMEDVRWLLSNCRGLRWQCSAQQADECEAVSAVRHDNNTVVDN